MPLVVCQPTACGNTAVQAESQMVRVLTLHRASTPHIGLDAVDFRGARPIEVGSQNRAGDLKAPRDTPELWRLIDRLFPRRDDLRPTQGGLILSVEFNSPRQLLHKLSPRGTEF